MPAKIAGDGDFIMLPFDFNVPSTTPNLDNIQPWENLPYANIVKGKNIKVINAEQIPENIHEIKTIRPWGWDFAIKKYLCEHGCSKNLLPTDLQLEYIRNLSHRKTTIPFRKTIYEELETPPKKLGKEIFSLEELECFLASNQIAFFKAPWSSSGRGVVHSSHISRNGLLEWAHGILRKQHSLIAEPVWEKALDFASEWEVRNQVPIFLGYSVFEASERGKYHKNIEGSQPDLYKIINKAAPSFSHRIIKAQEVALSKHISPFYEGPLGIDMLVDKYGEINPCVEINLRLTMGHIML